MSSRNRKCSMPIHRFVGQTKPRNITKGWEFSWFLRLRFQVWRQVQQLSLGMPAFHNQVSGWSLFFMQLAAKVHSEMKQVMVQVCGVLPLMWEPHIKFLAPVLVWPNLAVAGI